MFEETTIELIKVILEFFSKLMWPAIVFFVIYSFRKEFAEMLNRITNVKYPGGEVSIQREDPGATKPKGEEATQEKYIDPTGFYTKDGLTRLISKSGFVVDDEQVVGHLLFFRTRHQHTWLIATNRQLFCILDDEDTRASGRLIQWKLPLDQATPIQARISARGNPVVDVGPRRSWLYSRRLHPDEQVLETDIARLIAKGKEARN